MWMIQQLILKYLHTIVATVFPHHCYVCKKEKDNESICKECLMTFKLVIETPSPYITSIYSFKDIRIKKIIHAIKYFHRKDLLYPFAKSLGKEIQCIENYESYTLIPIPMPLLRKHIRGYNHSEILADFIGKELKIPVKCDILLRNPTQTKKRQVLLSSRKERLKNQHGAFIVTSDIQRGNFILIDDVTTTGATLHVARKKLLAHGASRVCAFTIAH